MIEIKFNGKKFAEAIYTHRAGDLRTKISVGALAELLGVEMECIFHCEGEKMPDLLTYARFCKWLGVGLETFFDGDVPPFIKQKFCERCGSKEIGCYQNNPPTDFCNNCQRVFLEQPDCDKAHVKGYEKFRYMGGRTWIYGENITEGATIKANSDVVSKLLKGDTLFYKVEEVIVKRGNWISGGMAYEEVAGVRLVGNEQIWPMRYFDSNWLNNG